MDFDYVGMPIIIVAIGIVAVCLSALRLRSLPGKKYRAWRRVAERMVLSVVILLTTALAASTAFNAIALFEYRAAHPPPGEFYRVDGYRMHMICTGSGSPTLLLEAGAGNDAHTWDKVQPELSRTTRVCAYDRAGFGWSEPQPGPVDADHVAATLHQLLLVAGINGPIILMGHSIGGLYIREYASRYPAQIAGIVFVDATSPAQLHASINLDERMKQKPWLRERIAMIAGIPRLLWMCSHPVSSLDAHASRAEAEEFFHRHIGPRASEFQNFVRSADESDHTGPFGALPIQIFSQDYSPSKSGLASADQVAQSAKKVYQWQEDLKQLSTCSRRINAKGSGHYIQLDRPDLINKEVSRFIEQIRGAAPQPIPCGATVTE